jgi:hypothetical protein
MILTHASHLIHLVQDSRLKQFTTCGTDVRTSYLLVTHLLDHEHVMWASAAVLSTPLNTKSGTVFHFHGLLLLSTACLKSLASDGMSARIQKD